MSFNPTVAERNEATFQQDKSPDTKAPLSLALTSGPHSLIVQSDPVVGEKSTGEIVSSLEILVENQGRFTIPDGLKLEIIRLLLPELLERHVGEHGYDNSLDIKRWAINNPVENVLLDMFVTEYLRVHGKQTFDIAEVSRAAGEALTELKESNRWARALAAISGADLAEKSLVLKRFDELGRITAIRKEALRVVNSDIVVAEAKLAVVPVQCEILITKAEAEAARIIADAEIKAASILANANKEMRQQHVELVAENDALVEKNGALKSISREIERDLQKTLDSLHSKNTETALNKAIEKIKEFRILAKDALDGTLIVGTTFAEVYSGDHCKLEERFNSLGREVRLTISAGSSLEKTFDEINQKSQEKYGRDAIYRGRLYKDAGVKDVVKETTVITFIPVLKNSENRVKFGTDPDTSHEGLLKKHNLDFVDRPYQTAAAGAFRIAKGFTVGVSIGSAEDNGDLFEGLVARARSGAVGSNVNGVYDFHYFDDLRHDYVVAVGSSPSN